MTPVVPCYVCISRRSVGGSCDITGGRIQSLKARVNSSDELLFHFDVCVCLCVGFTPSDKTNVFTTGGAGGHGGGCGE